MSYCRFSSGDVYIYPHVDGHVECCMCSLAPKVNSLFTEGDERWGVKPCKKCKGKGCDRCMMHDNTKCKTYLSAIRHLMKHRRNGDKFPDYALEGLREDMREEKKKRRRHERRR